jgi:hypothetical protein
MRDSPCRADETEKHQPSFGNDNNPVGRGRMFANHVSKQESPIPTTKHLQTHYGVCDMIPNLNTFMMDLEENT